MTYRLAFTKRAKKEYDRLDPSVQDQFKRKLRERLQHPRVTGDKLKHAPDCYKIKLRSAGYRLVYAVKDDLVVVLVLAIGRRDDIYDTIRKRLGNQINS